MKRLLLVFLGAAAALGLWFAISGPSLTTPTASATALLPRETLAFLHVPDVEKTRENLYASDLYKLWSEPAVQEFLQKPLANAPRAGTVRANAEELQPLGMKDAFVALVAWENEQAKIAGGFRFRGSSSDAEKVIGKWRPQLQENAPEAKRETIAHRHHRIDVVQQERVTIASVYNRDLFLAANDLELLKKLLDRADGELAESGGTIGTDENFNAAYKHMPAEYAAFAYARVDQYLRNLRAKIPADAATDEQTSALTQIRNVAAATKFENGKVRDVLFVGMPKPAAADNLTRGSLAIATADSFLYNAAMLRQPFTLPPGLAAAGAGMPGVLQRLGATLEGSGVSIEDWNAAFGPELGVIGDWPEAARLPALLAMLPVKDATAANRVLGMLTAAAPDGAGWTQSTRDGVQYYSLPPPNPMIPVTATIAIGERVAVAGLNPMSVEGAIARASGADSQLAATEAFTNAQKLVPAAEQSFTYVDAALLYRRLDAALRPMLVMSAAFMPKIAETVDLSRLPEADVIARHLSPLVVSQNYRGDGYVTESVGPFSMYAAAVAIAGATGAGAHWGGGAASTPLVAPAPGSTAPSLAAPAEPSPSPKE